MDEQPFPLPRATRETEILNGDGGTVYGPFGFKIFDTEDVHAYVRHAGEDWQTAAVTAHKVAGLEFDDFTVTFAEAVPATSDYLVQASRLHGRQTAVTRGGAISGRALEKELSKQGSVIEELRRDVNRYGSVVPVEPGRVLIAGGDGRMRPGPSADEISGAQESASIALEAAEAAQDARDAALAAVPNAFPSDRAALKALDTSSITSAYLKEPGREGQFTWRTGDYSAEIAADTAEEFYIKADSVAASAGAWVRDIPPTHHTIAHAGDLNISPISSDVVVALGEAAAGDGAASLWKKTAAPTPDVVTKTTPSGLIFERVGTIRLGEPGAIDPERYGIEWGSTADQSSRLATVIAAAEEGAILPLKGPIHLSSLVNITKRLRLLGFGNDRSLVTTNGNTAFTLAAGVNYVQMGDFRIAALTAPKIAGTYGLRTLSTSLAGGNGYLKLWNLDICGFDHGVSLEYCQLAELRGLHLWSNRRGYYSHRCVNMTLAQIISEINTVSGFTINGDSGSVTQSAGTLVSQCTAVNNGANGGTNITVAYNEYTNIHNCMIDVPASGSARNLEIIGCSRGSVIGNWIGASKGEGILATNSDMFKIAHNDILTSQSYGIALQTTHRFNISNNTLYQNQNSDILLYGGSAGPRNNLIIGNQLLSTANANSVVVVGAYSTRVINNIVEGGLVLDGADTSSGNIVI